jgi:CheY-like chemotaxis protein
MSKVLIVDDDLHAADAIGSALRILGYQVEVAGGWEAAVAKAAEFRPHSAVVDLMLPGISGIEVMQRLTVAYPDLFSCMATGMADYPMLKIAVNAGAWTQLAKPFQLAHLAAILQSASVLISAREGARTLPGDLPADGLTITRRGDSPVRSEDIARAIQFALRAGANEDTAMRRLPILAFELLSNARVHGAAESSEQWYRLAMTQEDDELIIRVSDSGNGFAWKRELTRSRNNWDKSKATGLQLATAICPELEFSDGEFTAIARIAKISEVRDAVAAEYDHRGH